MSLEGKSADEVQALAQLADDVLSKPDTAVVFQRLVKKNNPNVHMPLVDLEDRAVARFKKQDEALGALQNEVQQTRAEKEANVIFETLRDDGVVRTREDFNKLVTWASENGFMTSPMGLKKAAMQRDVEQESAEPTPSTVGQQGFTLGEGDLGKAFMKNPVATARTQAALAMDELSRERSKNRGKAAAH